MFLSGVILHFIPSSSSSMWIPTNVIPKIITPPPKLALLPKLNPYFVSKTNVFAFFQQQIRNQLSWTPAIMLLEQTRDCSSRFKFDTVLIWYILHQANGKSRLLQSWGRIINSVSLYLFRPCPLFSFLSIFPCHFIIQDS